MQVKCSGHSRKTRILLKKTLRFCIYHKLSVNTIAESDAKQCPRLRDKLAPKSHEVSPVFTSVYHVSLQVLEGDMSTVSVKWDDGNLLPNGGRNSTEQ